MISRRYTIVTLWPNYHSVYVFYKVWSFTWETYAFYTYGKTIEEAEEHCYYHNGGKENCRIKYIDASLPLD